MVCNAQAVPVIADSVLSQSDNAVTYPIYSSKQELHSDRASAYVLASKQELQSDISAASLAISPTKQERG